MNNQTISLSEIFIKQSIFFSRWNVLIQFLVIIFFVVIGWLLSKICWQILRKKFTQFTSFNLKDEKLKPYEYIAFFIQTIDFPVITLIIFSFLESFFHEQGWIKGLINVGKQIIIVYLILRCSLAFLYKHFPLNLIEEYQKKLFYPLFFLFVIYELVNLSDNLEELSNVIFIKLFNNPITLSSIFTLVIGLYFWFVLIEIILKLLAVFFKSQNITDKGIITARLLLTRYFLTTLGIVLILGYVGIDGRALATIGGGLSVGIGFALKEIISNFMSGIILLLERVLKPGDIISIEGQTCEVKELGIRATTVKNLTDNTEKIIPNQKFFTEDVITYTGTNNLVYCSILIGVGYNSSPEFVINLLLKIADNNQKVLKSPPPVAFFLNFGDSTLNFELKFWLDSVNNRKGVISQLNCAILKEFENNNINIPFPQLDIHIQNNDSTYAELD